MRVNGQEIPLNNINTLQAFLEQQGYDLNRIAVELNGQIITKLQYATEPLTDNDKLEIVTFVGGG
jgi:sulfur carrier protein